MIAELEALTFEHPYREPLWTQLITAYYPTGNPMRWAHRRVRIPADDPHRPRPDVARLSTDSASATAGCQEVRQNHRCRHRHFARSAHHGVGPAGAYSHDYHPGRGYPLQAAATRTRLHDNDIVLASANVSRHHAVIVDHGHQLRHQRPRSSNGVHVQHERWSRWNAPLVSVRP